MIKQYPDFLVVDGAMRLHLRCKAQMGRMMHIPGFTERDASTLVCDSKQIRCTGAHCSANHYTISAGITDKPEGIEADEAYPVQNDPSVASGEVAPREKPLPQNESSGPKAAGQEEGVGIENAGPTSATSADSEGSTQI